MAGLGTYANYLMTGKLPDIITNRPKIPDIKMPNLPDLTNSLSDKFTSIKKKTTADDTYLYKWRDANGVIHYTSEKPAEGIDYDSIKLKNDVNVIPAVPTVSKSEITDKEPVQQRSPKLPSTELPTNVYSPEGIKNLLNQAKNVQNLVNEQFKHLEDISNQE